MNANDDEVFTYSYDHLGWVTHVAAPSGTDGAAFTYDSFSNLLTVTGGGRTVTNTYNALGELLSQAQPTGTVSYQYDGG